VLHAKALHGNPFDGHTLEPVIMVLFQLERMLQIGFGALPLPRAFERDPAVVEQRPALGQMGPSARWIASS
jgi:hypothetical protein